MLKLSIITSVIASASILFMGAFLFYKNRWSQINRFSSLTALCAFGVLTGMFCIYTFPESRIIGYFLRISQISALFLFATLSILIAIFPEKPEKFPLKYSLLIYLPVLIMSPFIFLSDQEVNKVYFKDGILVREYGFIYYVFLMFIALYGTSCLILFIYKSLKVKKRLHRRQIMFVAVFATIAIFIGLSSSTILPFLFNYTQLFILGTSIGFLIVIFSIFYSIIYMDFMDITTAVHKTTLYTLVSAGIIIPVYIIVMVYSQFRIFEFIPSYIIAAFIIILFVLFSLYVQPVIDRLLRRKQLEFEKILDEFNISLSSSKELNEIIKKTVDILTETLFLRYAFFIIYNKEKKIFESLYSTGDPVDYQIGLNSSIIGWFLTNHEILDMDNLYIEDKKTEELIDDISRIFGKRKLKVIMPVYQEGTLFGFFCLGEKESLAAFDKNEIVKLKYLNTEINEHIRRVLDYEELRRDQFSSGIVDLSSEIMSKAIPLKLPKVNEVELGAFYIPKHRAGVDYFDIIRPSSTGIGIIATEIPGISINKAVYSVVLRSVFHSGAPYAQSSFVIMQRLNNIMCRYCGGNEPYVNAYYLYYDILSKRLVYTNAGHAPLEIYRIETNNFETLDTEGISLGFDLKTSYGMGRTNLLSKDIGVLFSRGLINSKNKRGEIFGLNTLHGIIKEFRHQRPSEITAKIKERFTSFIGLSPVEADIVVIMFKIL